MEAKTLGAEPAASPCTDLFIYYVQGLVKQDQALFQNSFMGNWQEDGFSFLFFSSPADREVAAALQKQPDLILLDQFHMSYEQWQGGRVQAFRAGPFHIVPPWENTGEDKDTPNDIRILLDPGVVFGTGTHPTTRDCLELMAQVCRANHINRALDMGTGTGLLAIAAAKLGCAQVLAPDFNFLAAGTAARNTVLNTVEDRVLAFQGRAEDFVHLPCDLLIANIHYDVMRVLIRSKGFLQKKWFILSGLLRSEAAEVDAVLSEYPVRMLEKRQSGGVWHTFCGEICP
ncbi:MAG: 50S ribosomal protein L11 methyltransferase [Desulfobacterales bacterium]